MNRISDALAAMERADRDKRRDDEARQEQTFLRLLRGALTEFFETKPWVKSVGTEIWAADESGDPASAVRFTIRLNHDTVGELLVTVERGDS